MNCACGYRLGEVTRHGCLRTAPGVGVYVVLDRGYAALSCPGCGERRYWRGGNVDVAANNGFAGATIECPNDPFACQGGQDGRQDRSMARVGGGG